MEITVGGVVSAAAPVVNVHAKLAAIAVPAEVFRAGGNDRGKRGKRCQTT